MIQNLNQYKVTKESRDKFVESYNSVLQRKDLHHIQRRVYLDAYRSQIEELNAELKEYEDRQ